MNDLASPWTPFRAPRDTEPTGTLLITEPTDNPTAATGWESDNATLYPGTWS